MGSSDKPENVILQKALQRLGGMSNEDLTRLLFAYGACSSSYAARAEWRELLQGIQNPHRLEHFGRKIYSQSEEDGIIEEIFRRVGITPRSGKFVEFGANDGVQSSNTLYLLHRKFAGLWIEASESHVRSIRNRFREPLESGQLRVAHAFVTAENIDELLVSNLGNDKDVALLSIDIDGNDFWVWKAINSITPAVVVIEYNGTFPPPTSITQEYRPDHVYGGTDYFGASVEALAKLGRQKGYQLVGCNITGVNAFFVREDLVSEHFPYPLTAETLYHPCRIHLLFGGCFTSSGHLPDFGKYVEIE
jgi:hypothetical protein